MSIPSSDIPGIFSFGGYYFSQRSPGTWKEFRDMVAGSGRLLPEILVDEEGKSAHVCREMSYRRVLELISNMAK
jgi:hypothetical protein